MAKKCIIGTCFYCEWENIPLTKDHIIPSSRGGKGGKYNIVMCCKKCNIAKSDNIPSEYLELLRTNPPKKFYRQKSILNIVKKNVASLIDKEIGVDISPKSIAVIPAPKPKKVIPFTFTKVALVAPEPDTIIASTKEFHHKWHILHRHYLSGKRIICATFGIELNTINFHN